MTETIDPRRVYERHVAAFNAKDAEADPWSQDAEFDGPGMQARGRGEVLGILRVFWDGFPDARNEVGRLISDGPLVSAEGTFSGTHTGSLMTPQGEVPPTGRHVEFRWSATCETRDGSSSPNTSTSTSSSCSPSSAWRRNDEGPPPGGPSQHSPVASKA